LIQQSFHERGARALRQLEVDIREIVLALHSATH
jgi:hypothetical protein